MAMPGAFHIARFSIRLAIAALLAALPPLFAAHAQDTLAPAAESLLQPGDIAASGFSGVKLQVEGLPPGVDPLSKTVIDPDGVTLRIYNGGPVQGPLDGQQLAPPLRTEFTAKDIGHVFGLAFDTLPADERGTPGLYAAATSAFGLYIVGPDSDGDGQPDRLMKGAPGARFMEGLFGPAPGGGAGAIWKIDSVTGAVSLYAELVNNGGPGIGGLAFDGLSRSLYVSDLDTGLIHQLKGSGSGAGLAEFDHGLQGRPLAGKDGVADDGLRLDITSPSFDTANPATWGLTQAARRIDGMAVQGRRLYYTVAEGPEVWSVGLADDGSFLGDARIEVSVTASEAGIISGIAFDNKGAMVLAMRDAVQNTGDYSALTGASPTDIIRYAPESPDDPQTASSWHFDTLTYPVGQSPERRDGSGGIALQYAYKPDGGLDLTACGGTLIASGDILGPERTAHGLQIGDVSRFQSTAGATVPTAFIALDPAQDAAGARGHAGGIAVLSQCVGESGFPTLASGGSQFPGVAGNDGQTGFPGVDGGGGQPGFPGVDGGGGQAGFPGVEGGGGQAGLPDVEGGGGQVFPDVEDGGGGKTAGKLTLAKSASVPKCSPKGGCAFNIEVTNDGGEIPGPITINELIEAPQAVLTGEPNAPWQCSKAAPFTCTHPGPVPANGKLDMRLVFAPNTPPEAKELKNCASIAGGESACATMALDPNVPVQTGPVVISKKGPASCPLIGTCTFEITLTNTTDAVVPGPIPFTDTIDIPGATLADEALPAPFACDKGGPPFVCRFGGAGTGLGPRESRTVPLRINLNLPAGTTSLKNCAVKPALQKKAELQIPLNRSLPVTNASFRPQSFAKGNGLLHLAGILDDVGGEVKQGAGGGVGDAVKGVIGGGAAAPAPAGGNIGGVSGVAQNCTRWGLKQKRLALRQSNGLLTYFSGVEVDQYSKIIGTARYYSISADGTKGPQVVGRVTSFGTDQKPAFKAYWPKSGEYGNYFFDIGSDGKAKGTWVDQAGNRGTFVDEANQWVCKSSPFCEAYADKAVQAFVAARKDGCSLADLGVPAGAGGRWTANRQEHVDFCMARASTVDPAIEAENKARTDGHASCLLAKKNRDACTSFAKDVVAINEQMKAISCKDALPNLTVEGGTSICLLKTGPDATVTQEMQRRLDVCKAQLAANGNAGAGGADAGGGGQAQEPAPEQCAVVAIEDVKPPGPIVEPPGPAPEQPKNLALAHNPAVAQCSDTGGGCAFTTSISNPADAPEFNGPIAFVVHLSQPDGSAFPNITMESGGEAPNVAGVTAPIACKKDGNDVTCTAAAAKIPPGKSVPVPMSFKPGGGTMATAIKSCASFAGAEPSCANISLVKGSLLRAQKTTAATSCVPNCAFAISLKNIGTDAATGPFVFTEDFKPINGDTTIETVDGDFACSNTNGTFGCISTNKGTNVLKPGETLNGRVNIKTSTTSPAYTNCIDYNPAANAKPSPFDKDFAGRCVTIKDATQQGANLMIEVIPPNARPDGIGECSLDSECDFKVRVKSNGAAVVGTSAFDAKVANGIVQSIGIGGLQGGAFSCSQRAGDTQTVFCQNGTALPPGELRDTSVPVTAGATWKKNDTLTLCAQIPPGDSNPNDDKACASVKLDPFSVKVAKSGDQSCTQGGDCHFTLRLFNPGLIDHNAPVTISDKLTGLASAQIVSITPPLPCATQPTQIPFSCTSPGPVRLDLDAPEGSEFGPRDFKMVVRLPNDASATQFSNCADVSGAAAGAASAEESCVTVKSLPPPATVGDLTVAKSAVSASCSETEPCQFKIAVTNNGTQSFPGPVAVYDVMSVNNAPMTQVQLVSGPPVGWTCLASAAPGMQCSMPGPLPPKATVELTLGLQPLAGSLGAALKIDNCAEIAGRQAQQKSCASIALKQAPAQAPGCGYGMVLTSAGLCACPAPKIWNGRECGYGSGGASMSKPGDEQPKPALPVITTPPATCGSGMILAGNGLCACPANTRWTGKACEGGKGGGGFDMIKQATPAQRTCPADRPVGDFPNCCPNGTKFRFGKCSPLCAGALVMDEKTGRCVSRCKRGTHLEGDACVSDKKKKLETNTLPRVCPPDRPVGAYPNCCPQGTDFRNGKCRFTKAAPVKCRKSQMFDAVTGVCIDRVRKRFCPADRPVGAYPNCCPEGYQFANGKCRRFREQRQEQQYCPADRPVGIYPNCCPEGYQFTGRRCRPERERQEEQACPASRPVGVYPNCCPEGYQFTGRRCRKFRDPDQQQPEQNTRPNRKTCPDGTVVFGKYSRCPNEGPAPRPQPQPQPQPQQCAGGKVSTPSGCLCPNGKREDGDGQCVESVR